MPDVQPVIVALGSARDPRAVFGGPKRRRGIERLVGA